MTTTASAHALPTVEPAQDAGILPCPHFEGVEKRVEIDFHDGSCEQGASPGLPDARSKRRRAEARTEKSAVSTPDAAFGWLKNPKYPVGARVAATLGARFSLRRR